MTTTKGKLSVRKETIFKKPSCSSALYKRRETTVVKKASELATLCGVDLCIICYDREGDLIKTWPKDISKVRDIAERYSRLNDKERNKKSTNLSRFLNKKASSLVRENHNKVLEMESSLESRLRVFKENLRLLLQDQTNVVVSTDLSSDSSLIVDHQQQQPLMNHPNNFSIPADLTTPSSSLNQQNPLMNHPINFSIPADLASTPSSSLNQYPSNFSILLYNHEDGTFTQLPNSAPPAFEQPAIPYYNQDCGTTSYLDSLLGEEGMRSCNNFDLPPSFGNQDCGTSSSYLDLLLVEEDMRSCNNFVLPPSFGNPTMIIS